MQTNIRFTNENLKALLLRLGTRQRCPTLQFLFNIILEVLVKTIGEEKKLHPNRKKKVRLTLFANDMIVYTENIKESTYIQKILELNSVRLQDRRSILKAQ